MSRIALILTALLVLAAPASAKELGRVSLCGADGCTDVTKKGATERVVEGGAVTSAPKRAQPYFLVRIGIREGEKIIHTFDTRWLPKAALLRGADGVWMHAQIGRAHV